MIKRLKELKNPPKAIKKPIKIKMQFGAFSKKIMQIHQKNRSKKK